MKKCPHCAEENQETEMICRYCGHDLQSQKIPETKKESIVLDLFQPPAWKLGALGATAFTLLTGCAAAVQTSGLRELTRDLLFVTPISFLLFWLVCTFMVWASRQAL